MVIEDERLTGLERHVTTQINVTACQHVLGALGLANDFRVAFHLQDGRLRGAVENGEHDVVVPATGNDIDAVIGDELYLLATDDGLVALTPVEQTAQSAEHGIFGLCTSFFGEGIVGVAWETAREVLTHIAVGTCLRAVHHNLCAIVQLRYALHSQQ